MTEVSGKRKGGGICFYKNSSWGHAVIVIQWHSSPVLETFFINCKPFYSPREFTSFILFSFYIPPLARMQDAQRTLANQILCVYPDSLVMVFCDFNRGNLSQYRQFINCRPERKTLWITALGHSDPVIVHLIPAYRQKLKLSKTVVRTCKKWTREAVEALQACLDCTDSSLLLSTLESLFKKRKRPNPLSPLFCICM